MVYSIADVMNDWQKLGVFDTVLPFLLIFAVVFGLLSASKIFSREKGVNLVIALAIGLMSLQLDFVRDFYREVFPRFGVAIAVFIVILILASAFIPSTQSRGWILAFGITGLVLGAIAVINSFNELGWGGGGENWWTDYGSIIILGILLIILIVAIFKSDEKSSSDSGKDDSHVFRK